MDISGKQTMAQFQEVQSFGKKWKGLFLIVLFVFIAKRAVSDNQSNSGHLPIGALIIIAIIVLLAIFLTFISTLYTRIDASGIYYKFVPLHREEIHVRWDQLSNVYVRKYKPILEYGGWGIKGGLLGKGRAYNVWGNMGIQLVFSNGNKLLLGTQKATEVENILKELKNNGIFTPQSIQED